MTGLLGKSCSIARGVVRLSAGKNIRWDAAFAPHLYNTPLISLEAKGRRCEVDVEAAISEFVGIGTWNLLIDDQKKSSPVSKMEVA